LFNLVTTIILLPFTNLIVKLVCILVPEKKHTEEEFTLEFIDDRLLGTPPVAVGNIRMEIVRMGRIARDNMQIAMEMLLEDKDNLDKKFKENERKLDFLYKQITEYLTKLIGKELSLQDESKVGSYYRVVSDIERVGDYAENLVEYSFSLREQDMKFSDQAKLELNELKEKLFVLHDMSFLAFDERNAEMLVKVKEIEEEVDDVAEKLEGLHVERVKQGACTAQLGSVYLKTVSHLERMGDHIYNVAKSIKKYA
jgi:phosphate:Na+ symporter